MKGIRSAVLLGIAGWIVATFADESQPPDQAWEHILSLRRVTAARGPASGADRDVAIDQLNELVNSANEFWQLYPDNPHMWEAKLIALRLGQPPAGYGRWSLQLLADELVALEVVESICPETVRKTLKKTG